MLNNDKELFEALLRGERIEKVRHAGFGDYIFLDIDGNLKDKNGIPANIYKITTNDLFQIYQEKEKE